MGSSPADINRCYDDPLVLVKSGCATLPLNDDFDISLLSKDALAGLTDAGTLPKPPATEEPKPIAFGEDDIVGTMVDGVFVPLDIQGQTDLDQTLHDQVNQWIANVFVPTLEKAGVEIPALSFGMDDARLLNSTAGTKPVFERALDVLFQAGNISRTAFEKLGGLTTLASAGGGGASGPSARDTLNQDIFDADQAQQQFENQLELDGIDASKVAEIRRQFEDERDFVEFVRQFDAQFGAGERSRLGNLGLGLAQEGRLRQQLEMQILSEPADFLARAFNQFGVDSPFGEVTQADLLNRLRDEFANVDSFISEQEGLTQSRLGSPSGGGGDGAPASSDPNAGFPLSSQGTATGTRLDGSTQRLPLEGAFADTSEFRSVNVSPTNDLQALATSGDQMSRIDSFQQAFDLAETSGAPQAVIDQTAENLRLATQEEGLAGAKHGGFIKDKEFLVGDMKKGAEETILNPTGAPLAIVPTPGRRPDRLLRGFAHGTAGIGDDFTQEPEPIVTKPEGFFQNEDIRQRLPEPDFAPDAAPGGASLDGSFSRLSEAAGLLPEDRVTQEGLQQAVFDTAPPAVTSVLEGQTPSGPDGQLRDVTNALPPQYSRIFTPQQFASLTPDEQTAMRTALAAFNVSLDDYLFAVGKRFGSQRTRARGRMNPLR